jgi:hypothetical protein
MYIRFFRRTVEYGIETGAVGLALRTKMGWNRVDASALLQKMRSRAREMLTAPASLSLLVSELSSP